MKNNLLLKYYYNNQNDIDSPFLDCDKYFEELLIKNNLDKLFQIYKDNNEIIKIYEKNQRKLINDHYSILINIFENKCNFSHKLDDIIELEPKINIYMNNIIDLTHLISKKI